MPFRRNIVINFLSSVCPVVIMVVATPIYIRELGSAAFGAVALMWTLISYFTFFDFGFGRVIAAEISSTSRAEVPRRSTVFWTGFLFLSLVSVALGGGAVAVIYYSSLSESWKLSAFWFTITIALINIGTVPLGVLEGSERFHVANVFNIANAIVGNLMPIAFFYLLEPAAVWIFFSSALIRIVATPPIVLLALRQAGLQVRPIISKVALFEMVGRGSWIAATTLIIPLLETVDRLIVGYLLGATAAGYQSIAYNFVRLIRLIPTSVYRTAFPRFSALGYDASVEFAEHAIFLLSVIVTPVIVTLALQSEPIVKLWIGEEYARETAPIISVMLLGLWPNCVATVPFARLQATGGQARIGKLNFVQVVPYFACSAAACFLFGLVGAAVVWTARVCVDALMLFSAAGLLRVGLRNLVPSLTLIGVAFLSTTAVAPLVWDRSVSAALLCVCWLLYIFIFKGRQLRRAYSELS
ncbi:oligosaccharide flippase family protein [Alsobacter sp. SYSU BS001988]